MKETITIFYNSDGSVISKYVDNYNDFKLFHYDLGDKLIDYREFNFDDNNYYTIGYTNYDSNGNVINYTRFK